jgi:hypothetical protein
VRELNQMETHIEAYLYYFGYSSSKWLLQSYGMSSLVPLETADATPQYRQHALAVLHAENV